MRTPQELLKDAAVELYQTMSVSMDRLAEDERTELHEWLVRGGWFRKVGNINDDDPPLVGMIEYRKWLS